VVCPEAAVSKRRRPMPRADASRRAECATTCIVVSDVSMPPIAHHWLVHAQESMLVFLFASAVVEKVFEMGLVQRYGQASVTSTAGQRQ